MSTTTRKPTLRRGSKNNDVKQLQQFLRDNNFGSLEIDGDFGPLTEAAVKKYQSDRGLVVDGIVGPATWARILHELK
jgi:peptidoglycan hydrolase-like protein with peptidoglycan-binding domain